MCSSSEEAPGQTSPAPGVCKVQWARKRPVTLWSRSRCPFGQAVDGKSVFSVLLSARFKFASPLVVS